MKKTMNVSFSDEQIRVMQLLDGETTALGLVDEEKGVDVIVLSRMDWEELLGSLNEEAQRRFEGEQPIEVTDLVEENQETPITSETELLPDQLSKPMEEPLHPAPDFELEAGEIDESDDVLD